MPSAYNNRGAAYYKKGEFGRAIEDFNRAIDLKRDDAEVPITIAVLLTYKKGDD